MQRGMGMSGARGWSGSSCRLALPVILGGIRLSLVINLGTATIGSTVAAKGLGEVIIAGLLSNNPAFILQGGLMVGLIAVLLYDAMNCRRRPDHPHSGSAAAPSGVDLGHGVVFASELSMSLNDCQGRNWRCASR